jgi:hypothetical protein
MDELEARPVLQNAELTHMWGLERVQVGVRMYGFRREICMEVGLTVAPGFTRGPVPTIQRSREAAIFHRIFKPISAVAHALAAFTGTSK